MRAVIPPEGGPYPYAGPAYANPDAVTQIANGLSTTTFSYDNAGNVIQKTVDGTTTTYTYDYLNRLTALGVGGATEGNAGDDLRVRLGGESRVSNRNFHELSLSVQVVFRGIIDGEWCEVCDHY
jgi:hypothetical protein